MSDLNFGVYPGVVVNTLLPLGLVDVDVPQFGRFQARVVFPVSGQQTYGLEKGAPVVVAFEEGDPKSPFVLGWYLQVAPD
jgi:hypothetical protein